MLPRARHHGPKVPSSMTLPRGTHTVLGVFPRVDPHPGHGQVPAATAPPHPPARHQPLCPRLLRQIYRDVHTLNRKACLIYKCDFN